MTATTKNNQVSGGVGESRPASFFSTLDFKIRRFIVRLVMGHCKLARLEDRTNKKILNKAVEKMYDNMTKYLNESMGQATSKASREMLTQVILQNETLTELQKAQITSIIDSASVRDSSKAYLG